MMLQQQPLSDQALNDLLAGTGVVMSRSPQRATAYRDIILFGPAALWALGYLYLAFTL